MVNLEFDSCFLFFQLEVLFTMVGSITAGLERLLVRLYGKL